MKKIIVFALLIFLFPIITFGLEIDKIELNGENETANGQDYILEVNIGFKDLNKESTDLGIFAIEYFLSYDNRLIPSEINTNGYTSTLSNSNGEIIVTNIYDKTKEEYLCKDKTLICTDYQTKIKFAVLDNYNEKIEFKVSNVKIYALPIEKGLITQSDVKTKTSTKVVKKEVNVKIVENTQYSANSIVVGPEKRPTINTPKLGTVDSSKSSNNYLKSLLIEGYDIDFVNTTSKYKIIVPDGTKEVKVECEPEESKAECKVFGNTNLDTSSSIVVKVTAENGMERDYTITVSKLYEEGRNLNQDGLDRAISSINMNVLIVVAAIIFVLIIIVIIFDAVKSRKIEKTIDKFE